MCQYHHAGVYYVINIEAHPSADVTLRESYMIMYCVNRLTIIRYLFNSIVCRLLIIDEIIDFDHQNR